MREVKGNALKQLEVVQGSLLLRLQGFIQTGGGTLGLPPRILG